MSRNKKVARVDIGTLFGLASSLAVLGCSCFVAGTRVLTPRGPRRIEELSEGDKVWSWSLAEGRPVVGTVRATLRATADGVLALTAGELSIPGVTRSHPFWSPRDVCWRPAGELAVGDALVAWLGAADAREVRLDAAAERAGLHPVFNLTVDGEHNYFAEGLLVHNKEPATTPPQDTSPSCDTAAAELCDDEIDNDCDGDIDADDEDCAEG